MYISVALFIGAFEHDCAIHAWPDQNAVTGCHVEHYWHCYYSDDNYYSYCVEDVLFLEKGCGEEEPEHLAAVIVVVHNVYLQKQVWLSLGEVPRIP